VLKATFTGAAVAAVLATATAAQGLRCSADVDLIRGNLAAKYGEAVVGRGVAENGTVLEMWGNSATGSWTVTMSTPDQICLVADGDGFSTMPLIPAGADL
jgi:hypothetical protein